MTDRDPNAFANGLIADMRAHGGAVTTGPMAGRPILIATTTGAKSGVLRQAIITFSRDGDAYVVAGTDSGADTDPSWIFNMRAHPTVSVEAEGRTFDAVASFAEGADRDRLWDAHVAVLPYFAEYPSKTARVIPMVRLTPVD